MRTPNYKPKSILTVAITAAISALLLYSCAREKDEADQAVNPRGGRCYIKKDNSSYICHDFNDGYDANTAESTCTTQYDRYKSATSLWGKDWLVGDNNSCDTAGQVGNCTRTDGVVYYFSKFGTAAAAETDCVSVQVGVWRNQ